MKRSLALFFLLGIVGSGLLLWLRSWVQARPHGS